MGNSDSTSVLPAQKWNRCRADACPRRIIITSEAFDDAGAGEAHVDSEHFQEHFVNDESKQFVAQVPDIIYLDAPDRDGWDKMSEF